MLALYRRLLAYRRATPALRVGSYEAIDGGTERCYIYARATPTARVIVALNLTGEPVEVRGCGWAGGKIALSTHLDHTESLRQDTLHLRADEGVIVEAPYE